MTEETSPEQARAQIQRAQEIQEARRNARANRDTAPTFNADFLREAPIMINGVPHLPAPPARDFLMGALYPAPGHSTPNYQQYAGRAALDAESLALLDEALALLEGRSGDRTDSLRKDLEGARAEIARAADAFQAIGDRCQGPLALELIERIKAGRKATADAHAAFHAADGSTVRAAREAVDVAEADGRQLDRDIAAAIKAIHCRTWRPSRAAFEEAKHSTRDLERLPKKPTAAQVKRAIEEGERGGAQALFWICFETQPDLSHELLKWRWRAYTEAAGEEYGAR